jgi:hypothetical protein
MTTTADREAQEAAKEAARQARAKDMEAREKKLNEGKSGKGPRTFLGLTRGKNPQEIQYEAFDDGKADQLPTTLSEFMALTGLDKVAGPEAEKQMVSYLIAGYNDVNYTAASDPIAEYIDTEWSKELQTQFRNVVRNYSVGAKVTIEAAVALIKPGIDAAHAATKQPVSA